jgi:hypothetical protein
MEAKQQKRYVKSFCKEKEFDNGGSVIKVSINKDDFNELEETDKGYVNLVVAKRKEVGQFGDTHYIYFDSFKPKAKTSSTTEGNDLPF